MDGWMKRVRYNNKKKRTGSRFKQGYYQPVNPEKFRQSSNMMNTGPFPFYRSSWELKMYRWCDQNENIEFWGTESVHIPYFDPVKQKMRRYFPDVFIKFNDGRKVIIEIKPASQNNNPTNQAKWEQAQKYAKQIGGEFVVMNEKQLGV
jgi:hypothetical protein